MKEVEHTYRSDVQVERYRTYVEIVRTYLEGNRRN